MKVILLNGSPAENSHTRAGLAFLAELFTTAKAEATVVDLLTIGLNANNPIYHHDASESPDEKVRAFAEQVNGADIVVLGTPLYHGVFSGLLKTALDNLDDDALKRKKVLLLSNSSGIRNSQQAAQSLVVVARTMGGEVYNRLIGTCKADYGEHEGKTILESEEIIKRCKEIVESLVS